MAARFDHLVVAVEDLDEAAARWRAAGIPAERGGAHPVGTVNALVRGPGPAYVELIAAGSEESNPWLDRVRGARGPISWAIAVDDVDEARAALVVAGFEPQPVTEGSRRTPDGDVVAWRTCDVGPGPYDDALPFLIEWTAPMPPGPRDGAVVEWIGLSPADPDRVADLLVALGFVPSRHWPRRQLEDGKGLVITLGPLAEQPGEPAASLSLTLPSGDLARTTLDGVGVTTRADRRRLPAASLLPRVEEAYDRLAAGPGDPWALRAEAWVEAVVAARLGRVRAADVAAELPGNVEPLRASRLCGPHGTQPVTVVWGTHPSLEGTAVVVGVGDPVVVLERQPEWGSPSAAHGVERIDDAFVLALSGGVYAVREGHDIVIRSVNGWTSDGLFADGEAEQWLADADAGRRTDGVVAGETWV